MAKTVVTFPLSRQSLSLVRDYDCSKCLPDLKEVSLCLLKSTSFISLK